MSAEEKHSLSGRSRVSQEIAKKGAAPRRAPSVGAMMLRLALHHLQLVLDTESAEQLTGAHAGNLLVHRAVHSTDQRDVSVINDDANRTSWIDCVLAERGIAIDGTRRTQPQAVVIVRHRCNRHLVDHIFDSGHISDVSQGFVAANASPVL